MPCVEGLVPSLWCCGEVVEPLGNGASGRKLGHWGHWPHLSVFFLTCHEVNSFAFAMYSETFETMN
jgi:hypothetical protein